MANRPRSRMPRSSSLKRNSKRAGRLRSCSTRMSTSFSSTSVGRAAPLTRTFIIPTRTLVGSAAIGALQLREHKQRAGLDVERVDDTVGVGDLSPHRGIAIPLGSDAVERL